MCNTPCTLLAFFLALERLFVAVSYIYQIADGQFACQWN